MKNNTSIVVGSSVDTDEIRAYDYSKGDRRFHDLEVALSYAEDLAIETGRRQRVRQDSGDEHAAPLYLVQEVDAPRKITSNQIHSVFNHGGVTRSVMGPGHPPNLADAVQAILRRPVKTSMLDR